MSHQVSQVGRAQDRDFYQIPNNLIFPFIGNKILLAHMAVGFLKQGSLNYRSILLSSQTHQEAELPNPGVN